MTVRSEVAWRVLVVACGLVSGCAVAPPQTVDDLRERSDHFGVRVEPAESGWRVVSLSHLACRGRCRDGEALQRLDYLSLASGAHEDWVWTFTWPASIANDALLDPATRETLDAWIRLALVETHRVLAFIFGAPPPALELWVHFVPDDVGFEKRSRNYSPTRVPLEFWHRMPVRARAYADLPGWFRQSVVNRVFGGLAHEYAHVWLHRYARERGIPIGGKSEEVLAQTLAYCTSLAIAEAHIRKTGSGGTMVRLSLSQDAFDDLAFPLAFPTDEELARWWQQHTDAPYNHYFLTYPLTMLGVMNAIQSRDISTREHKNALLALCRGMYTDPVDLDTEFYPADKLPDDDYFTGDSR